MPDPSVGATPATNKVMLVDGNSLTYRAFFALPTDMATASGQVTNAVFGFTSMLINLIRDHQPDHVVVAFDRPEPTFRHERIATYKGNRDAAPDILRQQMGLVRQVRRGAAASPSSRRPASRPTTSSPPSPRGPGTPGTRCSSSPVTATPTSWSRTRTSRCSTTSEACPTTPIYDEAGIEERTGVAPTDYVQYAALRGDPSDNLPGVPGVGEKTAAKLINTYGDLDGIFAHLDDQTPKLRQNLAEHEEQVRLNAEVMVLLRDVPLEVELDDLTMGTFDAEEVRQLFDFLEFRTLFDRLAEAFDDDLGPALGGSEVLEAEVVEIDTAAEAVAVLSGLAAADRLVAAAGAWRAAPGRSPLEGLALVTDPAAARGGVDRGPIAGRRRGPRRARRRRADEGRHLAAHGAKPLLRSLTELGVDVRTSASTRCSRPTCSTRPSPATCSRNC